jgi:hypothetical protein
MGLLFLAAGLCLFTLAVHVFVGERRIVRVLLQQRSEPFARATLLVVWHMVSWTLALSVLALGWAAYDAGTYGEGLLGQGVLAQEFFAQGFSLQGGLLRGSITGARLVGLFVAALCAGYALLFLVLGQRLLAAAIRLPQWILLGTVALFSLLGCLGGPWAASVACASLLLAIAAVHALWALGVNWPASDKQQLSLSVAGRNELPPASSCVGVAIALLGMALVLLSTAPAWAKWAIAAIFVVRGTLGWFEPLVRREIIGTPYLLYSRYMYTPLSLCIGIAAALSA